MKLWFMVTKLMVWRYLHYYTNCSLQNLKDNNWRFLTANCPNTLFNMIKKVSLICVFH